mgnify:CR=1 FL=1
MAEEHTTNPQAAFEQEVDIFEEYEQILSEYKRREMLRNMGGIGVSVVVHLVLVLVGLYVIEFSQPQSEASLTAESVEMDIKEIPPKEVEELEKLETEVDQPVPEVSKPEPTTESVEQVEDITTDVAAVDSAIDVSANLTFSPIQTSLKMPGLMSGRTGEGRRAIGNEFGIGGATENAILKALRWLKEHQEEEGYWMKRNNAEGDAMSGLALLAFLAHGDTPSTSREFGVTVQKAIDYLVQRIESSGRLGRAYTHGIVAYALAEAYAMTNLPEVGMAAEKALEVIISGQQPGGGYNYRYSMGNRWDLSVASWQFQAMKAASVAGIELPGLTEAKIRGIDWLKNVTYRDGAFGYSSPGGNRLSMCGAGTLVLQLLDEHDCEEVRATLEQRLTQYKPRWEKVNHNAAYSWYYMTQAIFHGGREPFKNYFPAFSKMLVENQADDGHWDSPGRNAKGDAKKGGIGRDVYMSTAMNCLSLQVAYRYLPSYKSTATRTAGASAARTGGSDEDDDGLFDFEDEDLGIKIQ